MVERWLNGGRYRRMPSTLKKGNHGTGTGYLGPEAVSGMYYKRYFKYLDRDEHEKMKKYSSFCYPLSIPKCDAVLCLALPPLGTFP